MMMNDVGLAVQAVWRGLSRRFSGVELDELVVMPNHLHGIIVLVGAQFIAPSAFSQGAINRAPTLGEVVRVFKAASTRQIRVEHVPEFGWQRNYYEHIIRDEASLHRIREYIVTNPLRWEVDRENPQRNGEDDFDRWFTTSPNR